MVSFPHRRKPAPLAADRRRAQEWRHREVCVFRRSAPQAGRAALVALAGFLGLPLLVAVAGATATGFALPLPLLAGWAGALASAGLGAWRLWRMTGGGPALRLWGWQLVPHAAWTPALATGGAAFGVLAMLPAAALALLVARAFAPLDRAAALLMLPAAAWAVAAILVTGF